MPPKFNESIFQNTVFDALQFDQINREAECFFVILSDERILESF